mmetsp:Transcript_29690/g.62991  ORF Transcript_29690/g.62991 Transcript_29690/m.62991 type:complete len:324 (+) Transcript_29690:996-1967(+)
MNRFGSPQLKPILSSCAFLSGKCFTSSPPSRIRATICPTFMPARCSGQSLEAVTENLLAKLSSSSSSLQGPSISSKSSGESSFIAANSKGDNLKLSSTGSGTTNSSSSTLSKFPYNSLYSTRASTTSSNTKSLPKSSLRQGTYLCLAPFTTRLFGVHLSIIPIEIAISAISPRVSLKDLGAAYLVSSFCSSNKDSSSSSPSNAHCGGLLWSPVKKGSRVVSNADVDGSAGNSGAVALAFPSSSSLTSPSNSSSDSSFLFLPRFFPSAFAGGSQIKPRASNSSFREGFDLTNVPWLRMALTRAPKRKPRTSSGHSSPSSGTVKG